MNLSPKRPIIGILVVMAMGGVFWPMMSAGGASTVAYLLIIIGRFALYTGWLFRLSFCRRAINAAKIYCKGYGLTIVAVCFSFCAVLGMPAYWTDFPAGHGALQGLVIFLPTIMPLGALPLDERHMA